MGHGRGRCPKPVKEEEHVDGFDGGAETPAAAFDNVVIPETSGEADGGEGW